jgi:hypothetical protein
LSSAILGQVWVSVIPTRRIQYALSSGTMLLRQRRPADYCFNEADPTDFTAGEGHVASIVVSPLAKSGYKSIAFYQHQSVLLLRLEGLGVTKLRGDAASAPAMWEFFN